MIDDLDRFVALADWILARQHEENRADPDVQKEFIAAAIVLANNLPALVARVREKARVVGLDVQAEMANLRLRAEQAEARVKELEAAHQFCHLAGPGDPTGVRRGIEAQALRTRAEQAEGALASAAIREQRYSYDLQRAEAVAEDLRAQLHGMQDGALLRDTQARLERAEAERDEARQAISAVTKDYGECALVLSEARRERAAAQRELAEAYQILAAMDGEYSLHRQLDAAQREVGRLRSAIKRALADLSDPIRVEHLRGALATPSAPECLCHWNPETGYRLSILCPKCDREPSGDREG